MANLFLVSRFCSFRVLIASFLWVFLFFHSPLLWATHEIDHRFRVYGTLQDEEGKPIADGKVIVVALRNGAGSTTFTNKDGHYDVILHLHNEDAGDTIEVSALDQKKKVIASFDASDRATERRVKVDFDMRAPQTEEEKPLWIYGLGAVLILGIGVSLGFMKKRKKSAQSHQKLSSKKKNL